LIVVDGYNLSITDVVLVARRGDEVAIAGEALERVEKARRVVERLGEEQVPVYGVTTGFGEMCYKLVPKEFESLLQENLIKSHAAGYGQPLPRECVRAMMLARLNCLVRGHSGVRREVVELLKEMLNRRVHPVVPEYGSLGASGDLAPLCHMAAVMIGEWKAEHKGHIMGGADALRSVGLEPLKLKYKEGLALVNGTSASTGIACLAVFDAARLLEHAIIATALSLAALRASIKPFDVRGHEAKPHRGQIEVARTLYEMLKGCDLVRRHEAITAKLKHEYRPSQVVDASEPIQNAYSLRVIPQVLGCVLDTLRFVRGVVETELNSSNDNPLVFEDGDTFHGANFHGQYVATAMDFLTIAVTQLALLSERRLARLINKFYNAGLPEFLVDPKLPAGLYAGFEGGQYIATALAAELRRLCNPASVQSIPTNADNQDFVSMSMNAALNARRAVELANVVVAVEFLAAVQALDIREEPGIRLGKPISRAYHRIREAIPHLAEDRIFAEDVAKMLSLMRSRKIIRDVKKVMGVWLDLDF